jgi:fatty acid desaturase
VQTKTYTTETGAKKAAARAYSPAIVRLANGLNYQIEHHLFPRLPRNKLRGMQPIVKDFCEEHAIAYHETSVLQSYREILQHLHEVGGPLREARKAR